MPFHQTAAISNDYAISVEELYLDRKSFIHSFSGPLYPFGSGLEQAHQHLPVLSIRCHPRHLSPWNAKSLPAKTSHIVTPASTGAAPRTLTLRNRLKHTAC